MVSTSKFGITITWHNSKTVDTFCMFFCSARRLLFFSILCFFSCFLLLLPPLFLLFFSEFQLSVFPPRSQLDENPQLLVLRHETWPKQKFPVNSWKQSSSMKLNQEIKLRYLTIFIFHALRLKVLWNRAFFSYSKFKSGNKTPVPNLIISSALRLKVLCNRACFPSHLLKLIFLFPLILLSNCFIIYSSYANNFIQLLWFCLLKHSLIQLS